LASTCNELLVLCIGGRDWSPDLLDRAIAEDEGRTLLSGVVEPLADSFDPRLSGVYDRLFRQVIERVCPELVPRLRRGKTSTLPPVAERVYVLSRVTLGADVAVTSVLLDAAKRRYPLAEIVFAGPRKNYELFEADPRISHREISYARGGTLRERLEASARVWFGDGIVLDPDSRITQLGLLSVCDPDRYFHFESRSIGGDTDARLPDLAAQWIGDPQARPYVSPRPAVGTPFDLTVSLGVGGNRAKRLNDDRELALLRMLAATGASILVDKGGTTEERARVERAIQPGMRTHDGPFAPFAAEIARSKLFVGYDSAAGHVASACGVPLISIGVGFASKTAADRWRPLGTVIRGRPKMSMGPIERALATCTFRR